MAPTDVTNTVTSSAVSGSRMTTGTNVNVDKSAPRPMHVILGEQAELDEFCRDLLWAVEERSQQLRDEMNSKCRDRREGENVRERPSSEQLSTGNANSNVVDAVRSIGARGNRTMSGNRDNADDDDADSDNADRKKVRYEGTGGGGRTPARQRSPSPSGTEEDRTKNGKHRIKPRDFDAKDSFEAFYEQFKCCARHNKWDDEEQLAHLTNSLTGNARQVLWDTTEEDIDTLAKLVRKLRNRTGPRSRSTGSRWNYECGDASRERP